MASAAELARSSHEKKEPEDPLSIDVTPSQLASSYGTIASMPNQVQSIILPWQHHKYNCTSIDAGFVSVDIAFEDFMRQHTAGWRFAQLLKLEAIFMPNHGAIKYPFTVECVWTPQSTNLTAKAIPNTFGSQQIIIGGDRSLLSNYSVKCNLKSMNPRIRDSITYNDTPRFNLRYISNKALLKTYHKTKSDGTLELDSNQKPVVDKTKKRLTTCRIYFRGVLKLSAPAFQFEAADDEE